MTVRNRLVMSPMETLYGTPEGLPSERTRAYFAARAAGGIGLVTVGATGIDHRHPETPGGLQIATDDSLHAHRALVEAVHEHGARIQPQIVHAGPDGLGPEMFGVDSLGPSVIQSYLTGRASTEIGPDQWSAVLDQYRAAANRVREAGYDGLELHAAHGYMLLGSFLAPVRNRRVDGYRGGSVRGRWRAVLEALEAVRSEVGSDFPVTLRVSGHERVAGGRPSYELARVAPRLVAAGVDAFHVSGGVIDRYVTQMVNGADDGAALNVGAASAVREVVDVPVIAVGRIHSPELAERILADGRADFIAMARPLLADPDLPNKLVAGTPGRVRRCISCENCIDAMELRFSVDCAVNPCTGKELELTPVATSTPRHVVVVGGGPGGMEAARVAAGRGHRVTLLERTGHLGGSMVRAAHVHPENRPFLDWLRTELAGLPVDVRLGVSADAGVLADLSPDAVVVAAGGRLAYPELPGAHLPHVVRLHDLDLGSDLGSVGPRTAIVGGGLGAIQLAEVLAARGRRVAVFETGETVAPEIGWKRKTEHLLRLDRLGVTLHTEVSLDEVVTDGLAFTPAEGVRRTHPADTVVLAGSVEADLSLHDELVAGLPGVEVVAVGDSHGPGLIQKAVEDGARAGAAL
jgi:2,4-dienoyl-CoA reductase (NADPH2)